MSPDISFPPGPDTLLDSIVALERFADRLGEQNVVTQLERHVRVVTTCMRQAVARFYGDAADTGAMG